MIEIETATSAVTDSGQSLSQISDMALFSLESLATSDLTEVSYAQLEEACGHFDDVLYREGGHKLGSGGFGEVYHCHLTLAGSAKEVAVKALISKVCCILYLLLSCTIVIKHARFSG